MNGCALFFTAPRQVEVRTEPIPKPDPGQVLVKTLVSGISSGTELLFYRGQVPPGVPADEAIDSLRVPVQFPLKYGYAAVGKVLQVGEAVERSWRDRLVFAFHPHESHFVAAPEDLIPLPENLSPQDAVFLANMETAVNLLLDGSPQIGERVVVFGQGIVGLLTTALLGLFPLHTLVTLDLHALRREHSARLGARSCLDPSHPASLNHLKTLLDSPERPTGSDLTFELSGNPEALNQAIDVATFDGRVVIGSWYGQKRTSIDLGGGFHRKRLRLISSQVSTVAPALTGRWTKRRRLRVALDMIERVHPSRLISHRFPISEGREAYGLLDQSPETCLQVVFTYP